MKLAERFGMWPVSTPAHALTAAQAILLAEALAPERKAESEVDEKLGKPKSKKQPKVPKSVVRALANKGGELEDKHGV